MSIWGIVPAAGLGSRIQPLAFSKELLPVGGIERPRAVSEYLIERMLLADAEKICIVISPGKSDIIEYFGGSIKTASLCYVVQPHAQGLCDALFRALPLLASGDEVLIGLPDTVWFPEDGLARLDRNRLSFLLFPVQQPELFDAVVTDEQGQVLEIQVKRQDASSRWVWGAFRMPALIFQSLHALWRERGESDVYMGTLVNAWLAGGGEALGMRAGEAYVDVGTLHGYREAIQLLESRETATVR